MSDYEAYKGKLTPTGKTLNEFMSDIEFPERYSRDNECDVENLFFDIFYRDRVVINGMVFIVEKDELNDEDIFESTKNDDGSYDFIVRYYNGGCSFDEAVGDAIDNSCSQGES